MLNVHSTFLYRGLCKHQLIIYTAVEITGYFFKKGLTSNPVVVIKRALRTSGHFTNRAVQSVHGGLLDRYVDL
jgi:hypothetical protein